MKYVKQAVLLILVLLASKPLYAEKIISGLEALKEADSDFSLGTYIKKRYPRLPKDHPDYSRALRIGAYSEAHVTRVSYPENFNHLNQTEKEIHSSLINPSIREQLIAEEAPSIGFLSRSLNAFYGTFGYKGESPWDPSVAKQYRQNYRLFTLRFFNNLKLLQELLAQVPETDQVSPDQLPASQQVKLLISGGTFQPFSYPIAKNHAAFAKARQLSYRFTLFSSPNSANARALAKWANKHQPSFLHPVQPYWGKVFLINRILRKLLNEGEWLAWIDDDIVINDFSHSSSQFDRIIARMDDEVCIVVPRDLNGADRQLPRYPNTGIILVRKTPWCRKVVQHWLLGASDKKLGSESQASTLHEQQYLSRMYYDNRTIEFEGEKRAVAPAIAMVDPRTSRWNLNTFKRFGHERILGKYDYASDLSSPLQIAAMPDDAFIHHTGMMPLYRLALIAHTLWLIADNYPLVDPVENQ